MRVTIPARATRHSPAVVGVALLSILLWSSSFIAAKVVLRSSPPLTLLAARFLVAAGVMALLARLRGLARPRDGASWGRLALFGLCNRR